jgi:hypothetical protein
VRYNGTAMVCPAMVRVGVPCNGLHVTRVGRVQVQVFICVHPLVLQVSESIEPATPTPFTNKGRKENARPSPSPMHVVNIHLS